MRLAIPRLEGVLAVALIVVAAATYLVRLDRVPPYLGLDEAHFGVHAHHLATTGRNLDGLRLPLFVSLTDPMGDHYPISWGTTWYQPIGFYLIAAGLTVLPLSEWSIRLPLALTGLLSIALIYSSAFLIYRSRRTAWVAAAALAMSPALVILSRQALDYVLPLPFILAWLCCLTRLVRGDGGPATAAAAGVILGVGCYSYIVSWVLMPLYAAATAVAVISHRPGQRRLLLPLGAGFVLPLLLLLVWLVRHPEMIANITAQYQVGNESNPSLVTAVLTRTEVAAAARNTLRTYWSYFNPSFLFVNGGASRNVSTGQAGVIPLAVGVLAIAGLRAYLRERREPIAGFILFGLGTAALPAALKGEPFAIQRAIGLLPFGILAAAAGYQWAAARTGRGSRVMLTLIVLSIPAQFAVFARDYFTDYRSRSADRYDATEFREAASVLLREVERGDVPLIALTAPLYDVSAKWRFYATKAGRVELLGRSRYFGGDLAELSGVPRGTIAVIASEAVTGAEGADGWSLVVAPVGLSGRAPLTLMRKQ